MALACISTLHIHNIKHTVEYTLRSEQDSNYSESTGKEGRRVITIKGRLYYFIVGSGSPSGYTLY